MLTSLSDNGDVNVIVRNLTDDILTIDQTKTFFINSNGRSTAYYDPTVRTTSNTTTSGATKGGSINLGGIASAFGIGGIAGTLMSATNIGGSTSAGISNTYTEVVADLPQVSIGPRGEMALSKTFTLEKSNRLSNNFISADYNTSPLKFTISIKYSTDNGETWDMITSNFYCNSYLTINCPERQTNEAIRNLIRTKPNATLEPWFNIYSNRGFGYYRPYDKILNNPLFVNYD